MSEEGETNGQAGSATIEGGAEGGQAPVGEGGDSGGEVLDSKALFDAEIQRLTDQERTNEQLATNYQSVTAEGAPVEGASEGGDPAPEGGEGTPEGGESGDGDTLSSEEDGAEEPQGQEDEEEVSPKKQRNNWKKQAQEQQKIIDDYEQRFKELEARLSENPKENVDSDKSSTEPEEDIPAFDLDNATQEVKDLLEYTPGLDKMIEQLAVKAAQSIIEKSESDRAKTLQEEEQSKEAASKEDSYWTEVDSWFNGQYPDLSLSDVRENPDFTDWLEYRKNWVDAQLGGADRYDISGAKKVFERYVKENSLAEPQGESEEGGRRLAAARSPQVGKKTVAQPANSGNLFNDEVARLKKQQSLSRTI